MKIDFYTKAVLTVIAVVLTINLIKNLGFIETVQANENNLNSSQYNNKPIDVNIVSIKGSSWGKLDVDVKNTPDVKVVNTPTVKTK